MDAKFRKAEDGHFHVVRKEAGRTVPISLGEMTDSEFEAFLKKNRIDGMGAFAYSRKRKSLQKLFAEAAK